jgi:hypothetical protein
MFLGLTLTHSLGDSLQALHYKHLLAELYSMFTAVADVYLGAGIRRMMWDISEDN